MHILHKFSQEEAKEMETAIKNKDWENLKEELGDVLLQVVFDNTPGKLYRN